jgi:hypothetical protein
MYGQTNEKKNKNKIYKKKSYKPWLRMDFLGERIPSEKKMVKQQDLLAERREREIKIHVYS